MRVLCQLRRPPFVALCAAITFVLASAVSAQERAAPLSSSDIAARTDFLKRRGYVASYTVEGVRVTAVAGPKLRYIPSDESRRELCSWVLRAHKEENSAVTSARFVDAQGQLLLECAS
jgi:hypothetical protein